MSATFSLTEGGRLHAALARAGLAGGARGRFILVAVFIVLGWLPLITLTALAGATLPGAVALPLIADLGPWVRFFVVVPVLVLAEPFADRVLGGTIRMFRDAVVPEAERPRFDDAVERAQRLSTSDTAELMILVVALVIPHVLAASLPPLASGYGTWFASQAGEELVLTSAGRWYSWVSLPLVQFLQLRWAWRIVAWWRLMWQTSRLPLAVRPAHPDRAGGLGFLALAPNAFVPVFIGISALGSVAVSTQIWMAGRTLVEVRGEVIALVVLEAALLLVPQLFFMPVLSRARRSALMRYGLAGTRMADAFDRQWTDPPSPKAGELLESPHSSAMIDFGGTYGQVAAMRTSGISLGEVIRVVLPLAVPFAPLLLYQYSLKQIFQKLLQMVR
jgi:hypothetical protein